MKKENGSNLISALICRAEAPRNRTSANRTRHALISCTLWSNTDTFFTARQHRLLYRALY